MRVNFQSYSGSIQEFDEVVINIPNNRVYLTTVPEKEKWPSIDSSGQTVFSLSHIQ